MESIYVISTRERADKNKYKPGKYTGTINQLESQYETCLTNPIIYYYVQVNNSWEIEDIIKQKLDSFRIIKKNGRKSEWVKLDFYEIMRNINKIIKNYSDNSNKLEQISNSVICNRKIINNIVLKNNSNITNLQGTPMSPQCISLIKENESISFLPKDPQVLPSEKNLRESEGPRVIPSGKNLRESEGPTMNTDIYSFIIYNYTYIDINDMSLFEQYSAITSDSSPHIGILNNLNLNPNKREYHNMQITNKTSKYMTVYDGNDWIREFKKIVLSNVIRSNHIAYIHLYYKFRLFLKDDYLNNYNKYYNPDPTTPVFKQIQELMHLNIYNNTKFTSTKRNDIIILDKDDPVWNPLNKNFTWAEIEHILTKLNELSIHLSTIKNDMLEGTEMIYIMNLINGAIKKDPELKSVFKKFLERIERTLENNEINEDESISSETTSKDQSDEKKKPIPKKYTQKNKKHDSESSCD